MENLKYWESRMWEGGHTGWRDPAIYAFDQKIRINTVKHFLVGYSEIIKDALLDFGCGSGDFSAILSDNYHKIYLYDISNTAIIHAANRVKNGEAFSSIKELKNTRCLFSDMISVTVLQHIVDDNELADVLTFMYEHLVDEGVFICIESFQDKVENGIQRKWKSKDFENKIGSLGFKIKGKYNFYYPNENNYFFKKYINRLDVKILRRFYFIVGIKLKKIILKMLIIIAKKYNKKVENFIFPFSSGVGTKVYVLQKTTI